jgi:curved DNA-binding protein CbpA
MNDKRGLSGEEAEDWFREFAAKTGILAQPDYKLESLVRLVDNQLQKRLTLSMLNVHEEVPDAPDWLENILASRSVDISVRERLAFVKYILDKVVAIDDLIEVKNNRGQNIRIAIDVTTNYREEEEKLNKIRGLPELAEHQSSNRNKNIPLVRKQLGIDKHLILVLNNQIDKLPSHEKLLNDIYTFANDRSNTKSLNLFEVREHERFIPDPSTQLKPQTLWQTFSKGLASKSNPEISTQICIRAIRAGVSEANVLKMLEYDP